jgi:superfamily II DNA/RNA helicase
MSESLELELIEDVRFAQADKFQLLRDVTKADSVNDLAILVAMRLKAGQWGEYNSVATDIVRAAGLFPYLYGELSLRNDIAKYYHQSPSGREFFMHRAQHSVLSKLLSGESIILSAPTSFGKTFIVDELLLSGKYDNVMVVVPTIALIEEIRRGVKKLSIPHKRISFGGQTLSDKNIFIVTQERAHEMFDAITREIGKLDLLVIDEFYKMDKQLLSKEERKSGDRADLLSVVYREYSSHSKQVYLLGPHIQRANGYDTQYHRPTWIEVDTNTTYLEFMPQKATKSHDRGQITKEIILGERDDILIYCSSPDQTRNLYINYLQGVFEETDENDDLIAWISTNISANWYMVEALKVGIGVHHGRLPRFICQEMIRRFSDGRIKVLLCTSTVIEGVNTNAKAVVIFNNKKAFSAGYLTFRNIAGRAGRMFKHFYGKVYCFERPTDDEIVEVNDPIGTGNLDTSPSLLNLLEDEHLSERQRGDVTEHRTKTEIPLYLQKLNYFITIENQEIVINLLQDYFKEPISKIRGPELERPEIIMIYKLVSELGFQLSSVLHTKKNDEERAIHWAASLTQAYFAENISGLAKGMRADREINDETIEKALEFLRNTLGYKLPKYIRALDRLRQYALGEGSGSLEPFANRLEFLNTEPVYVQLDELGLPIEFSKKYKLPSKSLEAAAAAVVRMEANLKGFEKKIANNFLQSY